MRTRRDILSLCTIGGVSGVFGCLGRGNSILAFDDSVDADVRRRCRRAAERTLQIVDGTLDGPVRVSFVDSRASQLRNRSRFDRAYNRARHVSEPEPAVDFTRFQGGYNHSTRTISFVDPYGEAIQTAISNITDRTTDYSSPTEWYPSGAHLAHELTHAIQHDRVDSVHPGDGTSDGRNARVAVTEGMADYVAGRYLAACRDGQYDSCARIPFSLASHYRSLAALALGRLQYINGRAFVAQLAARGGWTDIWAAYRSPPATAVDTMFPDRYETGPTEPVSVDSPDTVKAWIPIQDDRLGVEALYTKLFALGIASIDDSDAALSASITERTTYEFAYRTPLLDGWLGDRFVAYGHVDDPDRLGYVWRTVWTNESDAERLASVVERAYDDSASRRGDDWLFDDTIVSVDHLGRMVTFRMAPDLSAAEQLR